MARFSSIAFRESVLEANRLRLACVQLRHDIANNVEIPQEDVDDFCKLVAEEDFYDFVKAEFPLLSGSGDENVPRENEIMAQIMAAAEKHLPPPYLPPAATDYPTALARRHLTIITHFVSQKFGEMTPEARAAVALSVRPLFEGIGAAVPEEIDKAARSGRIGRSLQKPSAGFGGFRHHPGAKPQNPDIETQTGVFNGGSTCYQNVVFRQLLSSPRARIALFQPDMDIEGEEDQLKRILLNMLEYIQQDNFIASKERLVKFWEVLKSLPGPGKMFAPGPQQDAEEFLSRLIEREFPSELMDAWGHITESETICLTCHEKTVRQNKKNIVYSLAIPSKGHAHLVHLLNTEITVPTAVTKNCNTCEQDRIFGGVTRLKMENGKPPEIVLQLKRFHGPTSAKVQSSVALPQWLFPVAGIDALYYVKYIMVHVGPSVQSGHYYSYERGSLAEDHERPAPEMPRHNPGDTGSERFWRRAGVRQPEPEKSFQSWTKYEDNVKTTSVPWSTIQNEFTRWYECTLVPVTKEDLASLFDAVAFPLRDAAYKAIFNAYENRTQLYQVFDLDGAVVPAVRAALSAHFNLIGDSLEDEPSLSQEETVASREVGFDAFTRLNPGATPPSSQDRQLRLDQANVLAQKQLQQNWDFGPITDPRKQAKNIFNNIFDSNNLLVVTLQATNERIRTDRVNREARAWEAWVEQQRATAESAATEPSGADGGAREQEQGEEDGPAPGTGAASKDGGVVDASKTGGTATEQSKYDEQQRQAEEERLVQEGVNRSTLDALSDPPAPGETRIKGPEHGGAMSAEELFEQDEVEDGNGHELDHNQKDDDDLPMSDVGEQTPKLTTLADMPSPSSAALHQTPHSESSYGNIFSPVRPLGTTARDQATEAQPTSTHLDDMLELIPGSGLAQSQGGTSATGPRVRPGTATRLGALSHNAPRGTRVTESGSPLESTPSRPRIPPRASTRGSLSRQAGITRTPGRPGTGAEIPDSQDDDDALEGSASKAPQLLQGLGTPGGYEQPSVTPHRTPAITFAPLTSPVPAPGTSTTLTFRDSPRGRRPHDELSEHPARFSPAQRIARRASGIEDDTEETEAEQLPAETHTTVRGAIRNIAANPIQSALHPRQTVGSLRDAARSQPRRVSGLFGSDSPPPGADEQTAHSLARRTSRLSDRRTEATTSRPDTPQEGTITRRSSRMFGREDSTTTTRPRGTATGRLARSTSRFFGARQPSPGPETYITPEREEAATPSIEERQGRTSRQGATTPQGQQTELRRSGSTSNLLNTVLGRRERPGSRNVTRTEPQPTSEETESRPATGRLTRPAAPRHEDEHESEGQTLAEQRAQSAADLHRRRAPGRERPDIYDVPKSP